MPRRIDAYSLRLFLATAREGSIARAAEREHIAPSALSRRMADLEQAFGVPLLVRSPHGISLTEAGQTAFARAAQIDDDLQLLVREVQAQSGAICGTVRLAANHSSVVGFLPERLRAFLAKYPLVEVAMQERTSAEVIRACLDDRADVGVGVKADAPKGLEAWFFATDPLIVVLPAGHSLARKRSLRFADVLDFPLVGVQSGGALDQFLRERAVGVRKALSIRVSVVSFDAVCRMVEAGLGIAVVPNSAASAYAGARRFVRRPLDESWAGRELSVYALRKTPRLRAAQELINALKG